MMFVPHSYSTRLMYTTCDTHGYTYGMDGKRSQRYTLPMVATSIFLDPTPPPFPYPYRVSVSSALRYPFSLPYSATCLCSCLRLCTFSLSSVLTFYYLFTFMYFRFCLAYVVDAVVIIFFTLPNLPPPLSPSPPLYFSLDTFVVSLSTPCSIGLRCIWNSSCV